MSDPFSIIESILRDVAAEKIIPRFQKLAAHEVSEKTSPSDLVTIADLEAEDMLTDILLKEFPGSAVLGEEAISKGSVLMDLFQTHKGDIWVIDPVDGTNNFAAGIPRFGLILALVRNGETIGGWIYDIPGNRMGISQRGAGIALNNDTVRFTLNSKTLAELDGYLSTKFIPKAIRPQVLEKLAGIKSNDSLFCAAHEYLNLLEGQRDFSFYTRIKPWDHLAGSLMIREAGGESKKWDGTPYIPGEIEGGLISAANPALWPAIQAHFIL